MEKLTESQLHRREQAETLIAIAAPALELLLAAGERLSRLAEPKDYEYYPVRSPEDAAAEAENPPSPRANNVTVLRPGKPA